MIAEDNSPCRVATVENEQFYTDVIKGLQASPKYLESKYFYDEKGDTLFQGIMNSPEYYLTGCEMEIFTRQTDVLAAIVRKGGEPFDLIELGAGDATKSVHLFKRLLEDGADFTYMPIDISAHVIDLLNQELPARLPGLKMEGLNGEYFQMLKKASSISNRRKVVLFLGSNIGNMAVADAQKFFSEMRRHLSSGDMAVVGVDLKKNPKIIRAAYDDQGGITKQFNINLLERINRELNSDFNLAQFDHYCSYDPATGSCRSYLISLQNQQVHVNCEEVSFKKDEYIWMEISQKYTVEEIDSMALTAGFKIQEHLFDSKCWFMDAVLIAG